MFDKEELRKRFSVFFELTPGKTLSTSSLCVLEHNSWYTAFSRTYQGENWKETFDFIDETVNAAIRYVEELDDAEVLSWLRNFQVNLGNLQQTYEKKADALNKIKDILRRINDLFIKINDRRSQINNSNLPTINCNERLSLALRNINFSSTILKDN